MTESSAVFSTRLKADRLLVRIKIFGNRNLFDLCSFARPPGPGSCGQRCAMVSLQVIKGVNEGSSIPLVGGKDKMVMGRDPECEIHIPVTSVSRRHAQIVVVQGKFFIEDLQSRNGTFINNQQISARTPLKNNDKIRICDFVAAF